MVRIPMVRCFLLEKSSEPQTRSLRFVPYNEFALWRYLMTHRYRFLVLEPEESLWIDEEERRRLPAIYERFDAERVNQVRVLRYLDQPRMLVPIHRYFPEQDYEYRKRMFLRHYENELAIVKSFGVASPVQETAGQWIHRKKVAGARRTSEALREEFRDEFKGELLE